MGVRLGTIVVPAALLCAVAAATATAVPAFAPGPLDASGPDFGFQKRAVAAADLTGDGAPEIVMAGDGIGALQLTADPAAPIRVPFDIPDTDPDPDAEYDDLAIADVTGDGLPDVVAVGARGIRRFIQSPAGAERRFARDDARLLDVALTTVSAADLDGDGDADLVVGGPGGGVVLRQEAPGVFGISVAFPAGLGLTDVAVGDLTGDGLPDIVAAGAQGALLLARDATGFTFTAQTQPFIQGPVASVALGSLDAGGALDVVASRPATGDVVVRLGGPGGAFGAAPAIPVAENPGALVLADLDGDGALDLVVARREPGADEIRDRVSVFAGTGAAGFAFAATVPVSDLPGQDQTGNDVRAIAVADVDRDGRPDLLAADNGLSAAIVVRNTTVLVTPAGPAGRPASGPGLTVTPARRQVLALRRGIRVRLACASACTIRITGRVSVGRPRAKPRVVALRPLTRTLAAGEVRAVSLAIPPRRRAIVRAGIARRARMIATVLVTARAADGTATTGRLVLRLVPPRRAGV